MKNKKQLIRDFHILLHRLGISDIGKEGILAGYGVDSSTELNEAALTARMARIREACAV